MVKLKLLFSDDVIIGLVEIANFYEQKQSGLGGRFMKYFEKHVLPLEEQANLGRIGKVFGTRELVLQDFPYIVVYRVRKTLVQLLLVYHQSRRYPT